jgi:tetratricopeptide (TPR) repeat protein
MAMAEGAKDAGAEAVSLDYMRRLLKNFPDLEIKGQSLHLLAMGEIARNTTDPREAIAMRQEMRRLYPSAIDQGRNLYTLAEEYRKIGAWEDMYRAYEDFLEFPDTVIPGIPDVRYQVSSDLAFHRSGKTWTMGSLSELVNTVQYSIKNQDSRLLTRLQSEEFFLMNWSQETSDSFTHIPMTLGSLLISGIRYKPELEPFSNDREAFLWTTGWAWKIDTWYLYFRRVDYPADPEINGRWEWAGIYFGERL